MGIFFWGTVPGRKEKAWHHLLAKNSYLFHKHPYTSAGHLIPGLSGMLFIAKVTCWTEQCTCCQMDFISSGGSTPLKCFCNGELTMETFCRGTSWQPSHNTFRVWHSKPNWKPDILSILGTWELVLSSAFSDFELTVSYCDHGVLFSEAWLQELLLYKELLWGRKAKALCPGW